MWASDDIHWVTVSSDSLLDFTSGTYVDHLYPAVSSPGVYKVSLRWASIRAEFGF